MPDTTVNLPIAGRAAALQLESFDEAARTVDVIWTTGSTVRRFSWEDGEVDEELVVNQGAVRMERLNSGAPFLNSHGNSSLAGVLGVVVDGTARIANGKGTATIRFSDRADVEPIFRDIANGIIRNVSVGYRVHKFQIEKNEGQRPIYRAVDWEPTEISAVAIGADPGAQFRSEPPDTNSQFPCVLSRADTSAAIAAQPKEAVMPNETTEVVGGAAPATRAEHVAPLTVDMEAVRSEARTLAAEVTGLCRRFGIAPEREAELIRTGAPVDAVRAIVLDTLAARDALAGPVAQPLFASVAGSRQDETETMRRGMEDALSAAFTKTEPSELGRQYKDMSLPELASIRLGERRVPTSFGARDDMLHRAFHSTSDFPLLLENSLNKGLQGRYAYSQPTYRKIAQQRPGGYQDFRDHSTIRMGDFPGLQVVDPNAGELKGGTFGEAREKTRVTAYGVQVLLTRELMVNDTLSGITQVLSDRGLAVARYEETVFYTMLLSGTSNNGPTMLETTRQMFNTTDSTLAAVASAITIASLGIGRASLAKRKSTDGSDLAPTAAVLLVGPDKQTEADQIVAPLVAQQAGNVNPFSGRLEVVMTPKITGNAWYLFANPAELASFEWGLLNGYTAPRFRTEDVFGVQGTKLSLEHDFGCGAIDYRGGYRNAGA